MNFRSINDMTAAVHRGMSRVPVDIDVVVGIPRSGMLPALMIGLHRNVMICDLDGFCEGRALDPGSARHKPRLKRDPSAWSKVLVVDDSVNSGRTFEAARRRLAETNPEATVITCAVFGTKRHAGVDLVLDVCPRPRIFEWNLMHHPEHLATACLDIDGVLCADPTDEENDDGPAYRAFLAQARPHLVPTVPVGHLVTSRLERYRPETEAWLARTGVQYGRLHMIDLPSAAERRRLGLHGRFKAEVYRSLPQSRLFIESDRGQAKEIAALSGKAVVCTDGMVLGAQSLASDLVWQTGDRFSRLKVRALRAAARLGGWKASDKAA